MPLFSPFSSLSPFHITAFISLLIFSASHFQLSLISISFFVDCRHFFAISPFVFRHYFAFTAFAIIRHFLS